MPHTCGDCIHFIDRESFYKRKRAKYCEVHDAYYMENHIECDYFESKEEKRSLINKIWK